MKPGARYHGCSTTKSRAAGEGSTFRALIPAIGPGRDPIQAYCDVLEEKWILSEVVGSDVGLEAATDAYLGLGAPAPEDDAGRRDGGTILDID